MKTRLSAELQHCILAHHGKLEYGSPKVPALIEAVALNYADDTDAKMETFKGILENNSENSGWLGNNRLFESNLRATRMESLIIRLTLLEKEILAAYHLKS